MGAVTALFEPLGVEWLLGFVFVFYLKRKELGAFNTLLPLPAWQCQGIQSNLNMSFSW